MAALISGLFLFIGLHSLRETGLRAPLQQRLGKSRYMLLFCLGIVVSVILIIQGKAASPFIQLWVPPYNWRSTTNMLMLSACILLAAGNLPRSYLRESLGHPMLLGVVIWGASHLLINGDIASLLLFGSLSLWAFIKVITLQLASANSLQQAARKRPSLYWDAAAVMVGTIAYGALLVFHGPLFGFALMPI